MRFRRYLAATTLALFAPPVSAWEYTGGEDSMTDAKSGLATEPTGDVGIGIKCWQGGRVDLRVMTARPWTNTDPYNAVFTIGIRVDKLTIRLLVVDPVNTGGMMSLVTSVSKASEFPKTVLGETIAQMRGAKTRVALSIGDQSYIFSTDKIRASLETLAQRCGLIFPSETSYGLPK